MIVQGKTAERHYINRNSHRKLEEERELITCRKTHCLSAAGSQPALHCAVRPGFWARLQELLDYLDTLEDEEELWSLHEKGSVCEA